MGRLFSIMAYQSGEKGRRLRRFLRCLMKIGWIKIPMIINPIIRKKIIVSTINFITFEHFMLLN
jgi:hypothetical protein